MTTNTNTPAGKYASVNGITLYYEIHGTWTRKTHELRNKICVLLNKRCLPA
jgi:hypothetical protein